MDNPEVELQKRREALAQEAKEVGELLQVLYGRMKAAGLDDGHVRDVSGAPVFGVRMILQSKQELPRPIDELEKAVSITEKYVNLLLSDPEIMKSESGHTTSPALSAMELDNEADYHLEFMGKFVKERTEPKE